MTSKTAVNVTSKNKTEFKNLFLFSLGQFVSVFGTSVYTFAIGLYVLKLTGSGLSFATTLGFGLVATIIFNPIAGVMADRFSKKKMVVIMDLLNGLLFIALYFVSLEYGLNLIVIYLSTFLTTVFTTIFSISFETAKPNIVSAKKLMNINSISRIINSLSKIAGPLVGGWVFAYIDIQSFIIINGISFIFSGISEIFIDFKYNYQAKVKEVKAGFIKDIKQGFLYIINRKAIMAICSVLISVNFFISFSVTVPLPYIINNVLKLSSKQFGFIQSALPVGMILGAICVKKVIEKVAYHKLLVFISVLLAVSMVLIAMPLLLLNFKLGIRNYLLYYSIIITVFGIALSLIDIPIIYILQKIIPNEFRGRVLSISISAGKIISPIGLMISGFLLNKLPAYILPLVGGVLLIIINVLILKYSNVENLDVRQKQTPLENIS